MFLGRKQIHPSIIVIRSALLASWELLGCMMQLAIQKPFGCLDVCEDFGYCWTPGQTRAALKTTTAPAGHAQIQFVNHHLVKME
jgi:hypothetical protein